MERKIEASEAKKLLRLAGAASWFALSIFYPACVHADTPISAAPPISADSSVTGTEQGAIDQTTVFNWNQVPKNQTIALTRATFDKGGYQLYDTAGDTILVPFVGNNLYVMRFAKSSSDTMYFENQADTPVLYLPVGGYLENATVPGARWYPINDNFQPTTPVYMGIAPTYDDFIGMGWFAGCVCDGGYYCDIGFGGGSYIPCPGYQFCVGDNRCFGWNEYRDYCIQHDPHYHTGYFDRTVYTRPGNNGQHFGAAGFHNFGNFNGGFPGLSHTAGQADRFSGDGKHVAGVARGDNESSFHGSKGDSYSGQSRSSNGISNSSNSGGNSSSSNSSPTQSDPQSFGGSFNGGGGGGFNGGGHSFGGGGFGGGGVGFGGGHGR